MSQEKFARDIAAGRAIEFDFPVINEGIQSMLHQISDALLDHYQRMDLKEILYSMLKELIINGVKANMKHYYFSQSNIDSNSPESLARGYELLKEKLQESELNQFESIAQENGLQIHVSILHSQQRIITLVENNTPMTRFEDKRIREKFNKALHYDSIAEFYMENADDFEGSGLGITMIVLMLKGNGIDPHAFTVNTQDDRSTVAKVELPLVAEYVIARNRTDGDG